MFLYSILDMVEPIEIHRLSEIKTKNSTVIIGFPGTGLVGSVAASQLIDVLGLEFVGYITSAAFAPLAAIHNYKPLPPARIHYSQKYNLVVILSEMSIPINSSMELADKLFSFSKEIDAGLIISLGGISLKEEQETVYVVSSDQKIIKNIIGKKLAKPIREGATTGVTGILLSKGVLESFPVLSILAEASQDYLDPHAASNALKVLSNVLGVDINTNQLEKDAKDLAENIRETVIKSKTPKKNAGNAGTGREGGGTMYG